MDNDNTAFDVLAGSGEESMSPRTGQPDSATPGAFSFSGRARRRAYWAMVATVGLIGGLLAVLGGIVGGYTGAAFASGSFEEGMAALGGGVVILLLLLVPLGIWGLAVQVRRCHDLGWSGWIVLVNILVAWIPVVGWIAPLIFGGCLGFMDGQPFTNQYGPDPKGRNLNDLRPRSKVASAQQAPVTIQITNQYGSVSKIGEELREWKKLQEEGLITKEEFDAQKSKIFAGGLSIASEKASGEGTGNGGSDGGKDSSLTTGGSAVSMASRKEEVRRMEECLCAKEVVAGMVPIPGKGYGLGKTTVTQKQWRTVMGSNPSAFKDAEKPVENVTWNDCQMFLKKLNILPAVKESGLVFRLPSVEEWEFACRAGTSGDYCRLSDGTDITEKTVARVAWFAGNSMGETHAVAQKEPNAFGLYDMIGNVWEWTQTSVGEGKSKCGGSWYTSAKDSNASSNDPLYPDIKFDNLGFRLCADNVPNRSQEPPQQVDQVVDGKSIVAVEPAKNNEDITPECKSVNEPVLAVGDLVSSMVEIPGKDFLMCKYTVTQAQWKAVIGENPSHFVGADNPVENVSWNGCLSFINRLNESSNAKEAGLVFRLPTAEEWEFACGAGATGLYGKRMDGTEIAEESLDEVAWFGNNSSKKTHPVGQKEPNAFGLYDMHGNVWEWTSTAIGASRVYCGGSCLNPASFCKTAARLASSPSHRNQSLGFRLCADKR